MSKDPNTQSTLYNRARTSAPPVTQTANTGTSDAPPDQYLEGTRWASDEVNARSAPSLSPATADNKGQRPRHIPTDIKAEPHPNNK